jgi:hypothetical protein
MCSHGQISKDVPIEQTVCMWCNTVQLNLVGKVLGLPRESGSDGSAVQRSVNVADGVSATKLLRKLTRQATRQGTLNFLSDAAKKVD